MIEPGTKKNKKVFDQAAYDKYDKPGKEAVNRHLIGLKKTTIVSKKEDFGIDIKEIHVHKGKKIIIGHEIEVLRIWTPEEGWLDHRIYCMVPERRIHFLFEYEHLYFWNLRSDFKEAWKIDSIWIDRKTIFKVMKNIEVEDGEKFFHIPRELCERILFKEKP